MTTIEILLLAATGIALIPAAYLALLAIASFFAKKTDATKIQPHKKVAFLIPAHNEETLLPITLNKIQEADYPDDLVQCFVIADNCSDETANVARKLGAIVGERPDMKDGRGKPFALRWFFKRFDDQLRDFDVISIIDADTEIDSAFIREITSAMEDPNVKVVQGYYGTSNVESSWRAALSEVALTVSHHVRALGRNVLNSTAGLKGNGMAFQPDVLLKNGWPAKALDEDLELSLILMEQGINVKYVPNARIYAEMASDKEGATKQRLRWEGGRIELIWKYGKRLLKSIFFKGSWQATESLLDLVTPPMVAYFLGLTVLTGVNAVFATPAALIATIIGLAVLFLITIQGLLMRGASKRCWTALLELPKFIFWKIGIYLKLINPKTKILWLRTTRDHEAGIGSGAKKPESLNGVSGRFNALRRKRLWKKMIKRTAGLRRFLDIMGSGGALVLLSPLFMVTALLIRLEDKGPIFFKQIRVGLNGKQFPMWKFRSMYTDAEERLKKLKTQNQHGKNGVTFKMKADPRVTRVGKFIRKYSIDELPQLLNVLRGDMSMVGPRPPIPSEVALYKSLQLRRLSAKPGLSCLWQIMGRSEIDFDGQVSLDLQYIHTATFVEDINILFKTLPAVLAARGAY